MTRLKRFARNTPCLKRAILRLLVLPVALLWLGVAPLQGQERKNIWISPDEISRLPTSGPAWENLKRTADQPAGTPDLSDQEQMNNVRVLAKALVYVRTGEERYRQEVINQVIASIGTERGGRTLALGRELAAYVIAADLVQLPRPQHNRFSRFLKDVRYEELDGKTLISTHDVRPNNWGTAAGTSRMAVAIYLDDQQDLQRAAEVFKTWLGETDTHKEFKFKDVDRWQADPLNPVGINPTGATKSGYPIGGVLPDEMRRTGPFTWPPSKENYVWTGLEGAIVQAVILHQAGYTDVWNWGDRALLRAYQWLYEVANYPAEGNDIWQMPVVDFYYGTDFWEGDIPEKCGKIMCWSSWTYGTRLDEGSSDLTPPPSIEFAPPSETDPIISSFDPTEGRIDDLVRITGNNLGTIQQVKFGQGIASEFSIPSEREIQARIPQDATTGPLVLTNGSFAVSSETDFVVQRPIEKSTTFYPVDDARICNSSGKRDENYGSDDRLRLRDETGGYSAWHSLLKFNVENLDGQVVDAKVRLYVLDAGYHGGKIVSTSSHWNESTVTWISAPTTSGAALDSVENIEEGDWAEFDVTERIRGNGQVSFRLIPAAGNSTFYASKEGRYSPELIVTTQE